MMKGRVSIILVTFNIENIIRNVLSSLESIVWEDLELIIVDNGSMDNTVSFIQEELKTLEQKIREIKSSFLPHNIGLSHAGNMAAKDSSGEYLLFLDHDVIMTPMVVKELVKGLNESDRIGAVQPRIVNRHDRGIVNGADVFETDPLENRIAPHCSESSRIFFPIGACFLTRRDVWHKIGGFDEDLFVEDIDVDFGWRLWLYGLYVCSIPGVEVYHMSGILRRKENTNLIFISNQYKSLFLIFLKNSGRINLLKFFLLMSTLILSKFIVSKRKIEKKAILSQIVWIFQNMKHILAKRKIIQSNRKIDDKQIDRMLKYYMLSSIVGTPIARMRTILRRER